MTRLTDFLAELKRRRVFRVAAVYAGVAFILVQIVDGTFDPMGIPVWVSRLIILLLVLGFPIAVALAWAFDITEKGLVRTKTKRERTTAKAPHHPLVGNKTLAVIAVLAIVFGIWSWLRVPSPGVGAITSIAVLPLENLMGDPEQEYFVDGMHEALTSELSKISALHVIGRRSTMRYKENPKPIPEIAEELDVDAVIEGSVFRYQDGDTGRITAQLVATRPERHLWSQDYVGDMTGIMTLQKTIARAIAGEIGLALKPEEESFLASTPQVNPEAYDLYLKGWHFRNQENPTSNQKAVEYLERAVALDPDFALAWANLGVPYLMMDPATFGFWSYAEAKAKMKTAIDRALPLDPNLSETYISLGLYRYVYEWDWAGAGAAFRKAIALNPGSMHAHYEYALFLIRTGRHDKAEAEMEMEQVMTVSPLSHHGYQGMGRLYFRRAQFDKAVEWFKKGLELEPSNTVIGNWLGNARIHNLFQRGKYEDVLTKSRKRGSSWDMLRAYSAMGREAEADSLFDSMKADLERRGAGAASIAYLHVYRGDQVGAMDWLEQAYADRENDPWLFSWFYPDFVELLGDDPRFQDLLRRMNFPE